LFITKNRKNGFLFGGHWAPVEKPCTSAPNLIELHQALTYKIDASAHKAWRKLDKGYKLSRSDAEFKLQT